MGKVKWLTGFIIICCSLTVLAQSRRQPPQQQKNSGQQANAQGTNDTRQQNSADTTGTSNASASQNQARQGAGNASVSPANTPAVPQTTTSGSGSPAVLSGKDGSQRDGTNNVQRASMNMAGSPANNLRLSEKRVVNADSEIKDRQKYSRDKQISEQRQNQKSGGSTAASRTSTGEAINDNNRKQNNALSDQNKSPKKITDKTSRRKKG